MDVEPRLLRYFLVLAEELHFGRAASKLYVSQPALSEAIQKLESNFGVILFLRDSRHVELTEVGQVLKAQAPEILKQIDRATAAVLESARQQSRTHRVGYSPFVDLSPIWQLRARLSRQTDSDVEFVSARTVDLVNQLVHGEIDAAIVVGPVEHGELATEVIRHEPFVVGLPSDHILAADESLRFEKIAAEDLIWLPRSFNPAFYEYMVAQFAAVGFNLRPKFEVTTLQECLRMIAHHRGVTLTTRSALSLNLPDVVFRPLREPLGVDTVAIFRRRSGRSDFLSIFITIAKELFVLAEDAT